MYNGKKRKASMNKRNDFTFYAGLALARVGEILTKGFEKEFKIRDGFFIYVQVCDDGDSIYVSINKEDPKAEDQILTLSRVNGYLSIENNHFKYEVTEEDLATLNGDDSENYEGILYYVKNIFIPSVKSDLRKISGLSVKNQESKFVWLNIQDGFSETWKEGDLGFENLDDFLLSLDDSNPSKNKDTWKLIEYKCHNEHDFQFTRHMRLR